MQNVHLRRAYEAQKKHICHKNRQEGGAREKLLYHGTTRNNCDSIMKTGFNRRFAGQNGKDPWDQVTVISGHCFNSDGSAKNTAITTSADRGCLRYRHIFLFIQNKSPLLLIPYFLLFSATVYGHGTYFAVNASYSAQPTYSEPAADGSQLMFVARVLTGIYTVGQSHMKVPPPRSDLQPHDLCDSVVDDVDKPTMYVVFHDNQAYPDYLITFKWLWGGWREATEKIVCDDKEPFSPNQQEIN